MKRVIFALIAVTAIGTSSGCCCLDRLLCCGGSWGCCGGGCGGGCCEEDCCYGGCDDGCVGCGGCGGGCCDDCGGGGGCGCGPGMGSHCGPGPMYAESRPQMGHQMVQRGGHRRPAEMEYAGGPPSASVTYPYYTTRGPRDYLARNPRGIGR